MFKKVFIVVLGIIIFASPALVFAQDPFGTGYLDDTNLPNTDVRLVAINLINVLLGTLGMVFLLLVLYGGFMWMVAGGNDDQAAKGRKIIGNAIVGLVVIFLAFAITTFVFTILTDASV